MSPQALGVDQRDHARFHGLVAKAADAKPSEALRPALANDVAKAVDRIYAAARRREWTIEKLAEQARKPFQTFNNWRQGASVPRLELLDAFAETVDLEIRLVDPARRPARGGLVVPMHPLIRSIAVMARQLTDANLTELHELVTKFVEEHVSGSRPQRPVGDSRQASPDRQE